MDKFLEIYGTLPRAGPGSNELTRRAFQCLRDLPASPRILDVGCGPGMQTVELLRLCDGTVVALDLLPQMIERVRARAESAGVADRLETIEQDMRELTFETSSFDVIWCEASIYILGFEAGLQQFRRLVRAGGYVAVSEVVWLQPDPPPEAVAFWAEYPEIDTVQAKLDVIGRAGFELVEHFLFPPGAWTGQYYDPMEERIAVKARDWEGDLEGEAVLREARHEIAVFRQHHEFYTYAFFVMRRPEP